MNGFYQDNNDVGHCYDRAANNFPAGAGQIVRPNCPAKPIFART